MEARVDGKVALVTGASRGIGEAIVRELLASGAEGVVITGRKAESLEPLATDLGERVVPVVGNAGDDDHVAEAVATAVQHFGALHLLVNNAGTNPSAGPLTEADLGAVDKTWAINLRAPLVFTREAWRQSMHEHGGAIVSLGSVGGLRPTPYIAAYNVSKAGLHHLTLQLAQELAPTVRVNAIAAGIVKTRLAEALWRADEEAAANRHPLRRLGVPDDIARATIFLLSEAASWITGVILPVDGGVWGAASP